MSWLGLRGRIGRQTYWLGYVLPLTVASMVLSGINYTRIPYMKEVGGTVIGITNIVLLLLIWPSIAGMVKRLHDRGRSGGWAVLSIVLMAMLMTSVGMGLAAVFGMGAESTMAITFGAIAVVLVNDKTFAKKEDALMDLRRFGADAAKIPVVQIKRVTLAKMLGDKKLTDIEAAIDKELKPKSVALTGWNFGMEVTLTRAVIACKNVVGFLPGSGPLADETIVLGAHYDHLGIESEGSLGGSAAKGKVHFGADDNASGTTGLLELAQRFGKMKSRYGRRIVFIAFSAEERGLFGSKFYANNPIFPIEKTVFSFPGSTSRFWCPDPQEGLQEFSLRTSARASGESATAFGRINISRDSSPPEATSLNGRCSSPLLAVK